MPEADTPEALVTAYLEAFTAWNDAAFAKSDAASAEEKSAAMDWASAAYAEMISAFAVPGTKLQGVAFGSASSHLPGAEQIIQTEFDRDRAVVKTVYTNPEFDFLKSRYEYELSFEEGRWWFTQVYFTDDDGRYPCL